MVSKTVAAGYHGMAIACYEHKGNMELWSDMGYTGLELDGSVNAPVDHMHVWFECCMQGKKKNHVFSSDYLELWSRYSPSYV